MSDAPSAGQAEELELDPVFLHSRREAIMIFFVWLIGLIWAVPFCYLYGYVGKIDPEKIDMIWGIPSWLFWGIGVPWIVADIFTTWFCFCYMKEDDLGEAHEGADIKEEIAEMHVDDASRKGGDA